MKTPEQRLTEEAASEKAGEPLLDAMSKVIREHEAKGLKGDSVALVLMSMTATMVANNAKSKQHLEQLLLLTNQQIRKRALHVFQHLETMRGQMGSTPAGRS